MQTSVQVLQMSDQQDSMVSARGVAAAEQTTIEEAKATRKNLYQTQRIAQSNVKRQPLESTGSKIMVKIDRSYDSTD